MNLFEKLYSIISKFCGEAYEDDGAEWIEKTDKGENR